MSHANIGNKNVYILNFGKVSTTNQTKRNQRKVMRSVCGPRRAMRGPRRAMRGRCTGCDARTSTDWFHLRDALRGRCTGCDARSLYGMRCAVVVLRDALRGRCTGCDARTGCICAMRYAVRAGGIRAVQAAPCF